MFKLNVDEMYAYAEYVYISSAINIEMCSSRWTSSIIVPQLITAFELFSFHFWEPKNVFKYKFLKKLFKIKGLFNQLL